MERLKAAERYLDKCKDQYRRFLNEEIERGNEEFIKAMKLQYSRYHRLREAIRNDSVLAEKLIYEATCKNSISTSSIGPCWERYLLECYEER
jgi:type III secretory pathway component EscR